MNKEEGLTIGITLEHEDGIVRAQRWLKGFVTLQVHENDINLSAEAADEGTGNNSNTVKVELLGKEITIHPTEGKQESDVFHEESSRHIMEPSLEAKCLYKFPFSIYVPASVPPSMHFDTSTEKTKGAACCIEYQLTASFQTYHAEKKIEMVGQPLTPKAHPATVDPSVVPVVTKSFAWKRMEMTEHRHRKQSSEQEAHHHGCLLWAAHLKNTHVGKGQDLTFSFSLRNASAFDVVKLSAKIVEKISLKTETDTLVFVRELGYGLMPNIAFMKNQKATLSHHQTQLVPTDQKLEQDMRTELGLHENSVVLKVPKTSRDSYKGKLVQVTHHLLVEARTADTHGKDHSATMTLELPLKVFDSPIEEYHHHHRDSFEFRSAAEVAEQVMTKWPGDLDNDLQASFTSIDDTSWDASDSAIFHPQIREET